MDEKLGKKARDKITGFTGIIVGKSEYLFGCNQYAVSSKVKKEGNDTKTQWFDEGRLEITGLGVKPKSVRSKRPGGIQADAPSLSRR